ncbi:unnamed protein product [Ceutorhynchus assimilis]|uniref:Peroxidase n=1 Tax=Ceutorhynchus assimilis TaxID=467358 RepID=A0A9N9M8X8_9CUCU|nr:unnamed protein product [Ceutorhynchus assimilis]
MSEQENSERIRLLQPQQPEYVFGSSLSRKRRIRQFQCCVCSILTIVFLAGLVITVSYTINLPLDDATNNTEINNETLPDDMFLNLFDNISWPLADRSITRHFDRSTNLSHAMTQGKILLEEKDAIENNTPSLKIDSPSYRHQKVLGTNEKARNISRQGYQMEGATQFIYKNSNSIEKLPICFTNFTDSFLIELCTNSTFECNTFHKYRSYNGTCNNLKRPVTFGVAYRPFIRAVKPDYADGISAPRISKNGGPLPTARAISLEVHRPSYRDDSKFSVMLAVWGQFLDHDITATALSQKQNGSSISCCQSQGILSPECFPVLIEKDDPFAQYNVTCMEFVRSAPCPTCCLGPREQMNQASAFIDGSVIYGNDESKVVSLRTTSKGLLKMFVTDDGRTLLPMSDDMSDGCNREEEKRKGRYCFSTGDLRANENLHLTSMHLIWARQHNLIANNILQINSHWDDEMVFQETRKIVAAQMQHITYNEFLPILLGKKLMEKHDLLPKSKDYFNKYNESVDPSIANEFATAAFRFAHTIIPGLVKLLGQDTSSPEFIQMRQMLFDPFKLYQKGQLDGTLKGAMNTSIDASDSYFSDELKSHLFERPTNALPKLCGLDLVSLNIQRGRDHGLAGYVFWKDHCGMNGTKAFDGLSGIMEPSSLKDIKAIYREVDDIDLYTGALSEKPIKGSILGPTLTCLILDQFTRIKYGDRFWYENPHIFTLDQLKEIRKTTLAEVICNNADELNTIQPRVMEGFRKGNQNIQCEKIASPDLSFWKENFKHLGIPSQQLSVDIIN